MEYTKEQIISEDYVNAFKEFYVKKAEKFILIDLPNHPSFTNS